jgi:hypothetical protein
MVVVMLAASWNWARKTRLMRSDCQTGLGHAGVILFRRSVSAITYGKQARLLVNFWREAGDWDWADRIEYLPRA